jgi:predicted 2-oxoglutarate/Fe(II)-dependent dioxygenase YbiX
MNKARRFELKMLHYKRRLKNLGLTCGNLFAYRSHGKPCSCVVCRNEKYKRNEEIRSMARKEKHYI